MFHSSNRAASSHGTSRQTTFGRTTSRRSILLAPLVAAALLLTSCGGEAPQSEGEADADKAAASSAKPVADTGAGERLQVATTFTVLADMASEVAGDHADVVSVTKPGAEIHNYQPTPQDIARTRNADLLLRNGLNLELWFEKFLARLDGVPEVVLSDGVEPISITSGPYDGKPNPHAWMSPASATIYVDNIAEAMAAADADNADYYRANAERYKGEIEATLGPLHEELDSIPEDKRWLVSSEGAFSYLARDLGLKELFLWPINADAQGTPQQVRHVIDTVRANDIPAVFSESTVSAKPAQQVARETDALYGGVLYVDSLSEADGPVPSYLDLLRVTTETIVAGLTRGLEQQQQSASQ